MQLHFAASTPEDPDRRNVESGGEQLNSVTVRTAGMFAELTQARYPTPTPSIHDSVAIEPLPDVDTVMAYLDAGHVLIDVMDSEDDPFNPGRRIANGSTMITDGEWLWRQDFTYYILYHDVIVPPEFLAAIRAHNYVVPEVLEERLLEIVDEAEWFALGNG
jgi:hypothetical protein